MKIDVIEYAQNRSRPENSVHYGKKRRFEKAKEQLAKSPVDKALIIKWVNEYLNAYGIESSCDNNEIDVKTISIDDFNRNIKNTYGLQDEKDIIWIKFTNSGHVGVVAASNDINFDIPDSEEVYDKRQGSRWKYNTSGIIVHYLKEKIDNSLTWDNSFFLLFPLYGLSGSRKERHRIETGVGNYLISKCVPILDFYSHRI